MQMALRRWEKIELKWVEYCNGTGDTALVKLRREHGFAKPHQVKYWSIGNEVDSPGQIGYKTPTEYADNEDRGPMSGRLRMT